MDTGMKNKMGTNMSYSLMDKDMMKDSCMDIGTKKCMDIGRMQCKGNNKKRRGMMGGNSWSMSMGSRSSLSISNMDSCRLIVNSQVQHSRKISCFFLSEIKQVQLIFMLFFAISSFWPLFIIHFLYLLIYVHFIFSFLLTFYYLLNVYFIFTYDQKPIFNRVISFSFPFLLPIFSALIKTSFYFISSI